MDYHRTWWGKLYSEKIVQKVRGKNKLFKTAFFAVMALYLLLRLVVTPYISMKPSYPQWVGYSIQVLMFFLIASMIALKYEDLEKSHIDLVAIFLIIASTLFLPLCFFFEIPIHISMVWIVISLGLAIWIKIKKINLRRPSRGDVFWILSSIVIGILLPIVVMMINPQTQYGTTMGSLNISTGNLVAYFIYFLATAAVLEETFFRGLLWGFLREYKIKDIFIFIIQSVLFLAGHINFFSHLFTFWVSLPLFCIIVSVFAWKSRSIAPSLLVHTLYTQLVCCSSSSS
jgi:membrane protease YdiL (CAAX protease family)